MWAGRIHKSSSEGEDKGSSKRLEQYEQMHRDGKENGLCERSQPSRAHSGQLFAPQQTWPIASALQTL